jgi:hypothetical protein
MFLHTRLCGHVIRYPFIMRQHVCHHAIMPSCHPRALHEVRVERQDELGGDDRVVQVAYVRCLLACMREW